MINDIYELIKTIMNKELRGLLTPTEFNIIAKQVQEEIFRGYFEDEARDKIKGKRGLAGQGYSNLSFTQRQRIEQFGATATLSYSDPNFTLPADLYFIKDRGVIAAGAVVQEVESQNVGFLANSIGASSTTFPTYEQIGNLITILPATIITGVTCRYLRLPADPKWTYTIVSNAELFNVAAGDYQDFELHTSEFSNIAVRMLSYFGINVRETEVTQYAESLKQKTDIKEEQ